LDVLEGLDDDAWVDVNRRSAAAVAAVRRTHRPSAPIAMLVVVDIAGGGRGNTRVKWCVRVRRCFAQKKKPNFSKFQFSPLCVLRPCLSVHSARALPAMRRLAALVALISLLAPPVTSQACPAMFTGPPACTTAVTHLPTCVEGAFPGTWFTLHKGAHACDAMMMQTTRERSEGWQG
jgi:hypothetical protein